MKWSGIGINYFIKTGSLNILHVLTGLKIVIDRVNKTFHIEIVLWQAWVQLYTVGLFVVTCSHTMSKPT